MKKLIVLSVVCVLCVGMSQAAVIDDYTGLDGISYGAFRGIGWSAPDNLVNTTNTRGGQLVVTNVSADVTGAPVGADIVMEITLRPTAINTLSGIGKVMLKDDEDRRYMFEFADFADAASDVFETITSVGYRRAEGLETGEFDWSQVSGYWIQSWDQQGNNAGGHPEAEIQFDVMEITSIPEPATMLLLGLGSLAALRRRKK